MILVASEMKTSTLIRQQNYPRSNPFVSVLIVNWARVDFASPPGRGLSLLSTTRALY
jgi:hypothetical protein